MLCVGFGYLGTDGVVEVEDELDDEEEDELEELDELDELEDFFIFTGARLRKERVALHFVGAHHR